MKELYNKYKREVWVGVVVSLITTVILKFGDWLMETIPKVGLSIFETLSNILYTLASTYSDNYILRILLLGCLSVMTGTLIKPIIDGLVAYKNSLKIEKKSKKVSPEKMTELHEEIQNELKMQRPKKDLPNISEIVKDGKRLGRTAILTILVFVFAYIIVIFFITTPMTISNEFNQDIVKIAPYVEESEVIKLKSDWLCVRSKADYEEIYDRINVIKEEQQLP